MRSRAYMVGVSLYRDHPVRRGIETSSIIWRSGSTALRDFAPSSGGMPVLIIPSLVNRFTILDLQPDHSFVKFLAQSGFRPLVVDWDSPQESEKNFSLEDYVSQRLKPALDIAANGGKVHVIGYCMGGNLALALSALVPEKVKSLSLLATPWDFSAGCEASGLDGSTLERCLRLWEPGNDYLPVEAVQSVFTAFQPLHAYRKFSAFSAYDQSSLEAARFVLTEDWLNDGVPLTIPAARESFGDWYARNVTMRNDWTICGSKINPKEVMLASFVVVPVNDRIVPPQSSEPLAHMLPHSTCLMPAMGHIGIMASPKACDMVWKPLVSWLMEQ